jgi:hypothetical protein
MGQDSSVDIATRYGLDGPGSKPVGDEIICPGTHPASYIMGTKSFPGVKRPGRGVGHPSYLPPRSKKEYSYTSTPPRGLLSLF